MVPTARDSDFIARPSGGSECPCNIAGEHGDSKSCQGGEHANTRPRVGASWCRAVPNEIERKNRRPDHRGQGRGRTTRSDWRSREFRSVAERRNRVLLVSSIRRITKVSDVAERSRIVNRNGVSRCQLMNSMKK
jgi:hypothetical protein